MLAEDFSLSSELQQRLSTEGDAHANALQELRDQVTQHAPLLVSHDCSDSTMHAL